MLGRASSNTAGVNLEGCNIIDDNGLFYLLDIAEKLEVLNFMRAVNLTDKALAQLFGKCERLTANNVNKAAFMCLMKYFMSWRCKTASYRTCDAPLRCARRRPVYDL